jgi:hypothetical protein
VDVGEYLAGVGTPVTEQPRLEVLELERLLEQRVVAEVEHTEAEVERCLHVRVGPAELIGGEGLALDGRPGDAKGGNRGVDGGRHGCSVVTGGKGDVGGVWMRNKTSYGRYPGTSRATVVAGLNAG